MFKYAPGMESGLGAALNMMRKHAEPMVTRELLLPTSLTWKTRSLV